MTEVNNAIYCYFVTDFDGCVALKDMYALDSNYSSSVAEALPCENRDNMNIAGEWQIHTHYAGELIAVGLNLDGIKSGDKISVADSLTYEGVEIPVTKVLLEEYAYFFSNDTYQYTDFNIQFDSLILGLGKNITEIHLGDTVSIISEYQVNEENTSYCSEDGVLYYFVEDGTSTLYNIPDRYEKTNMKLHACCDDINLEELMSTYKYDILYPEEYSIGHLASEHFVNNYIKQNTYAWQTNTTLYEYLSREKSLFLPMVIEDENYGNSPILFIYGDSKNHEMYDKILAEQDVFMEYAYFRKRYKPASISMEQMSYKELTSYDILEKYDFIFIEDDTYDYFGQIQYQILYDASYNLKRINYAENLEILPYADIEKDIAYDSVEQIILSNDIDTDIASTVLQYQNQLFPSLQGMRGEGDEAYYKQTEAGVTYAEDEDAVYYIGVTSNNKNAEFHLNTEKEMYLLYGAFKQIKNADIYLHAPVLHLEQDSFCNYSLGTDEQETNQEIYIEYDEKKYKTYTYESEQGVFPTVGTEDEVYTYYAKFELADAEMSTETGETTEEVSTEEEPPVKQVEAIPVASAKLSMKQRYYLNNNNVGTIYYYNSEGKNVNLKKLDETEFGLQDLSNADNLMKKILAVPKSANNVFILSTSSEYSEKRCKQNGYYVIQSQLSPENLKQALNVMNCKYFQYLGHTQCYLENGQYKIAKSEADLENVWVGNGSIQYKLKVSHWEKFDSAQVFKGWVYGIKMDMFRDYYQSCENTTKRVQEIVKELDLDKTTSITAAIQKLKDYVWHNIAYDYKKQIGGLDWVVRKTNHKRYNQKPRDYHGMCGACSRIVFAVMAQCGYDLIPCKTWENKERKDAGDGATHSISLAVINEKKCYFDFSGMASVLKQSECTDYYMMSNVFMTSTPDYYDPQPDNIGEYITFEQMDRDYSDDKSEVYVVTFDANGGKVAVEKKRTQDTGKLVSFPLVYRKGYLFKGWYTGRVLGKKVTLNTTYKKNTKLYARWEKIKVNKVTIANAIIKDEMMNVSYKKLKNVSGYQIRYSLSDKFPKGKTSKKTVDFGKFTVKVKNKKTYYVQIRAYVIDSAGEKVYGSWSKKKKTTYRRG